LCSKASKTSTDALLLIDLEEYFNQTLRIAVQGYPRPFIANLGSAGCLHRGQESKRVDWRRTGRMAIDNLLEESLGLQVIDHAVGERGLAQSASSNDRGAAIVTLA
jgi:hypothetical protein